MQLDKIWLAAPNICGTVHMFRSVKRRMASCHLAILSCFGYDYYVYYC